MPLRGAVFFVFNAKAVAKLISNPNLLAGIDCVVSGVPGVSLDELKDRVKHLTIEQALSEFKITQQNISSYAKDYCLALMNSEVMAQNLPKLGVGADESVRLALLNHVALLIHNVFAFDLLFKKLVVNGLNHARMFRIHGSFVLAERLDIRTLLQIDLCFGPQLIHLCSEMDVGLTQVGSGDYLDSAKSALRELLLLGYKGKTLMQRSFAARQCPNTHKYDAVFVVRARTEVASAGPLIRHRSKQGKRDIMLVDDLIKSPDATSAASATVHEWITLHNFASPSEIAIIFLRYIGRRSLVARRCLELQPTRVEKWGFLGLTDNATQVLCTAFASVPELLVHRAQLDRAIKILRPVSLVSFDTVDRWGALQGERCRRLGIQSIMVQNTAVDNIVYPWPLAMDHLVVGNHRLRRIFIASGADPNRVHAFGLPLQDDVLIAGNDRLERLMQRAKQADQPLRVLIATQPFVQEFDYNAALIADLEAATKNLSFEIEWIFKPHPREDIGKYDVLRGKLVSGGMKITLFTGPFENAIENTDIVLSRTSTSLEFAALGGVPGIAHLDRYPNEIIERLDYLRSAVTDKSFSRQDIGNLLAGYAPESRLSKLMDYSERRRHFLDEFFPAKGRATKRVARLIQNGSTSC